MIKKKKKKKKLYDRDYFKIPSTRVYIQKHQQHQQQQQQNRAASLCNYVLF